MDVVVIGPKEAYKLDAGVCKVYVDPMLSGLFSPHMGDLSLLISEQITLPEYEERYRIQLRKAYKWHPLEWEYILRSNRVAIVTAHGAERLLPIPHGEILAHALEKLCAVRGIEYRFGRLS